MSFPTVIGLGSDHGDDQAGWLVIDRLRERNYPGEKLVRISHPARLLDSLDWDGESSGEAVIICDACLGNGNPGSISQLRWTRDGLFPVHSIADGSGSTSTYPEPVCQPVFRRSAAHDFSVFELMELGITLGWSPASVVIWTLEGTAWNPGTPPAPAIQSGACQIADHICKEFGNA